MAAKSATLDNQILALIFNGTTAAGLFENVAAAPLTTLYVSLHTATPGATGFQNTNEAAYTGYARAGVARTAGGWTVSGASVSPAATITFPAATGGSETETFMAVGTASSGAGQILYYGPLSPTIAVSNGVTPQLVASSSITES